MMQNSKWNTKFQFGMADKQENGTIFSKVSFILTHWKISSRLNQFTSQPEFPETFCKWKTTNDLEKYLMVQQSYGNKLKDILSIVSKLQLLYHTCQSHQRAHSVSKTRYCFKLSTCIVHLVCPGMIN